MLSTLTLILIRCASAEGYIAAVPPVCLGPTALPLTSGLYRAHDVFVLLSFGFAYYFLPERDTRVVQRGPTRPAWWTLTQCTKAGVTTPFSGTWA